MSKTNLRVNLRNNRKSREGNRDCEPAPDVEFAIPVPLNTACVFDQPHIHATRLLSRREFEVLYWLALGKSGPEVGTILSVSLPTVRMHVRNIFRKLSASNIPHAVARAFWLGIFNTPRYRLHVSPRSPATCIAVRF